MDHWTRQLNLAKAYTLEEWSQTLRVAIDGNELNPRPRTYKKLVEKVRVIIQAMEERTQEWRASVPPPPVRN
jgi:CRISPR/Cas system-associated exonuclease Cas4 (RecB family)